MDIKHNKRNVWVSTPGHKFWEFLAMPNFKSLALLASVGALTLASAPAAAQQMSSPDGAPYSAYTGTAYSGNYGNDMTSPSIMGAQEAVPATNPNYVSTISPEAGAYIQDNARIEDTRPIVNNDQILASESAPPQPVAAYFTPNGDFVYGKAGQRVR